MRRTSNHRGHQSERTQAGTHRAGGAHQKDFLMAWGSRSLVSYRFMSSPSLLLVNQAHGRWYLRITVDGMCMRGGSSLPFCVYK